MQRNANTQTNHDARPSVDDYRKIGYAAFDTNGKSSCS